MDKPYYKLSITLRGGQKSTLEVDADALREYQRIAADDLEGLFVIDAVTIKQPDVARAA